MAKIITVDEIDHNPEGEIDALTLEYHANLCGCDRTSDEELLPYRDRAIEMYMNGETDVS